MSQRDEMALEMRDRVKGSGRWKRTICEFCPLRGNGMDHRGNWCLNTESGYYHCFRCGVKGFLPGFSPEDYIDRDEPVDAASLGAPEGFIPLTERDEELRPAIRYVVRRGITRDTAGIARLGACLSGELAGRIVVPILGPDNRTWAGWSARLFRPAKYGPKYRYPPGMPRRKMLYNQAALAKVTDEPLLVVEGVFDALPYYPHAVALLGKCVDEQLPLLLDTRRPLVVCLDGDAWCEGQMLALRLGFMGLSRVGYVRLPPKQDPNTVDPGWLRDEARHAI